jgi:hypothetical protein
MATCKLCEQEVESLKDHLKEEHDGLSPSAYYRLEQCKVCGKWFKKITAAHVGTHDMTWDEYERYDPTPAFMGDRVDTFRRIVEDSEPPPPPPKVSMRLADISSNPFSCFVEARQGCVYHFQKPIKGDPGWQNVPASDAYILLGSEDGSIPPKYAQLQFERGGK